MDLLCKDTTMSNLDGCYQSKYRFFFHIVHGSGGECERTFFVDVCLTDLPAVVFPFKAMLIDLHESDDHPGKSLRTASGKKEQHIIFLQFSTFLAQHWTKEKGDREAKGSSDGVLHKRVTKPSARIAFIRNHICEIISDKKVRPKHSCHSNVVQAKRSVLTRGRIIRE